MGAHFERIAVPGALEIPATIAFASKSDKAYDGYIALGCIIRGETYHFEIVSNESARGIMELGVQRGLCIGNGEQTVEDEAQALARASRDGQDKGGDAARACLALIKARARLEHGCDRSCGKENERSRRPPRRAARRRAGALSDGTHQRERRDGGAGIPRPRFRAGRRGSPVGEPDAEFFTDLLRGVPKHQVEIDRSVARCLSENWKLERIDSILRAILRAATCELIARPDVPAKVVIDEYVEIAHAFFSGEEPKFVNAALDKLAHRKRAPEFGETPPDDELQF